ncbi:MAG TPA: UDP-N-acetylmuramoylalanyl-D-glutamyl-2,6-diaminopimelate--D-alanyl-D-alanine ligase [Sneathiellales bacterium]|nr:UDP-N-acetylmuramoylalanyl-D-glutamyl-2,6-diaminopimelate--D-alanyl-D-alanine ligase [Sneathiellales bacterium]
MSADILWTVPEAVAATGGTVTGDWSITGVSIDSRSCAAGDLFIAISGPNMDGHDYVADALSRGCGAAVVSRLPDGVADDAPLLLVDDTQAAMKNLGAAARGRASARVLAVTGSVGKTGTKEALFKVLNSQTRAHCSERSFNNRWGVPLSLARMPQDTTFGIFELGMSHPGEIRELTNLIRPHVAIITTVQAAHLENFNSVQDIAYAKAEIFEGVENGGTAILNRDNEHFEMLRMAAQEAGVGNVISFGVHGQADARALDIALHSDCSCVSAEICGQAITYKVGIPGRHWVLNSLGVLATVKAVGADLGLAGLRLAELVAPEGRGSKSTVTLPDGSFSLIDESYNANPTSMQAALETLGLSGVGTRGRRIAILGDMLELGDDSTKFHQDLGPQIIDAGIDVVFTAGPNMASLNKALPPSLRGGHAEDAQQLLELVIKSVRPGDAVMVKGSFGSRMGSVVEALEKMSDLQPPFAAEG